MIAAETLDLRRSIPLIPLSDVPRRHIAQRLTTLHC